MTAKLSVNLNGPAYLRNRRPLPWPDVVQLGRIALEAGAAGLTVHPRPDGRHIRRDDVFALAALIDGFPGAEFNIEGYPDEPFLGLLAQVRPTQATFVPDAPEQATSDHGWSIAAAARQLEPAIAAAKATGARVSLFVDAGSTELSLAAAMGADRIELYTGPYGAAGPAEQTAILRELAATASTALNLGLGVNAGHDLTLDNLPALARAIPMLAEVSIGHRLTADALIYGMAQTVRLYLRALAE